MITNKVGSTNARTTTGAQGAQKARISRPSSLSAPDKIGRLSSVGQSNQFLERLHERPRLISEISDTHKAFCSANIAIDLLRKVMASLLKIKEILDKGEFSPELLNQIDIEKKSILEAIETQVFGQFVLDSSFYPVTGVGNWIEFTIPGLDFKRERLTDELVTLYINGRMLPLAFDRTATDRQLLSQFQQQAGYSHMTMRMENDKSIVLGIRDTSWRRWDGMVYVSGQAGRFAAGQPMSMQVQPLAPTIEDVTRLDLRETTDPSKLEPMIVHVNDIYRQISKTIKAQESGIQKLIGLCQVYEPEQRERTRQLLTQLPNRAAMTIYRSYSGPNRENVINLLQL